MKFKVLIFSIMLSLQGHWAQAQTRPGSLHGIIVDKSNQKAIPNALVKIENFQRGFTLQTRSNIKGEYRIDSVMPGLYKMTVKFTGFATHTITNLNIISNGTIQKDVAMEEASQILSEVVVIDEAALVSPNKTSTITSKSEIMNMAVRSVNTRGSRSAPIRSESAPSKIRNAATVLPRLHSGAIYRYEHGQPSPVLIFQHPYKPVAQNEEYEPIEESPFYEVRSQPLSTFGADVDVASYANVRRFLHSGQLPPRDAVRIEEMLNYFDYSYPDPQEKEKFSVQHNVIPCTWNSKHRLLHLGIQARRIKKADLPPAHLVFLIDVSGSMNSANKLPLLKRSLQMMVRELRPEDKVGIVVYASITSVVLQPTNNKKALTDAIENLGASGSTAGGAGLQMAYDMAFENLDSTVNNRVILATDGDFNVGISDDDELVKFIEEKRNKGVFLSTLGFGTGNYKDAKLEKLADHGNGNYAYIDNILEAKKVLVDQMGATLQLVAKDTKFQIEFNPATVKAYRLIGYENRKLKDAEFDNDRKDAGDVGAGHSVTVLYEIVPHGSDDPEGMQQVAPLKYQKKKNANPVYSHELAHLKIRFKEPLADKSKLNNYAIENKLGTLTPNLYLLTAVAEWGHLLRNSPYKGKANYENALVMARRGLGADTYGYRHELLRLMEMASQLEKPKD